MEMDELSEVEERSEIGELSEIEDLPEVEEQLESEELPWDTKIDGLILVARTFRFMKPNYRLDIPYPLLFSNVRPAHFKCTKSLECRGNVFFTRIGAVCDMEVLLAFTSKFNKY